MRLPPPWLRARRLPATPPPPPAPPQLFLRTRNRLPPPWARARSFSYAPAVSPGEVPPAPGGLSHAGSDKPFVERWAQAPTQLRRHLEKVSEILNSLMRQGQLYQTAVGKWVLVVGPDQIEVPGGGGLTGTFP